jgi:hypothetical protein
MLQEHGPEKTSATQYLLSGTFNTKLYVQRAGKLSLSIVQPDSALCIISSWNIEWQGQWRGQAFFDGGVRLCNLP